MMSNLLSLSPVPRSRKSFKIIKVVIVFLVLSVANNVLAEDSYEQNKRLTLELNNTTMRDVFNEIEKNSEYIFFYSDEVNIYKKVAVNVKNRTINEILNQVLKNTGYTYTVSDRQVFIKPVIRETIVQEVKSPNITVQLKAIEGLIVDKNGVPIIGANILIKGQTTGTITDFDGKFSLNVPENVILVVSYIGYETREIPTRGNTSFHIILEEDAAAIEEVVVVGYGVQKKVNMTGAVSAISTKQLENRVNTNLLSSVQGQVPGVTIISRPGQTPSINFRGRGNLKTSEPLYVIDGAIADATFFSSLDPNSIESISFLKDAASSAIYGSRAAFGVVLVKTKNGQSGRVRVDYNGYVGVKEATYIPKILDSYLYATLWNEGVRNLNPDANLPYSEEVIQKYKDGTDPDLYPNSNWYDLLLDKHAFTTQHSVNISGGGENVRYSSILGYTDDNTFIPGEKTKRYNLAANLQSDINKWLSFRSDIKFIQDDYKYKGRGGTEDHTGPVTWMNVLALPVTFVSKHTNGSWGTVSNGNKAATNDTWRNPIRILEEGGWGNYTRRNSSFNVGADIKPVKNLVLTGEMIYKWYDKKRKAFTSALPLLTEFLTGNPFIGSSTSSMMTYEWDEHTRLTYNGLANYSFDINKVHDFGILAGISYEHYKYQKHKSYRKNFSSNNMSDLNGGSSAPEDMKTEGGSEENKMLSLFGRLTYNYKERYLFEANIRRDASSRFHKDYRSAIFPSFSVGWRISEENFMEKLDFLSNFKLRASWGKLGNINNVGDYDYLASFESGENYNFENRVVNGIIEGRPANPKLTWETVTITDVGVDIGLFNNRLNIVADYYYKKTKDILLAYNVPLEVGIPSKFNPSQNIGAVENKGFELGVSYDDQVGDFKYHIGANIARNINKITDLGNSDNMIEAPWIKKVGYAIGSYYVYRTDGLLTQEDIDAGRYLKYGTFVPNAGDIKYVDLDGDGELTGNDREPYGTDVPKLTYGIDLSFSYKGFELSMFGQGVHGTFVNFDGDMGYAFFNNTGNPREFHLKRWTKENPNPKADYPRIYVGNNSHTSYNNLLSDFWLFNSDYFRIKNITFGYSIPRSKLSVLNLSAVKVYVAIENAFTFRGDKRMKDFDPESPSGRGTNSIGARTYTLGANISF